MNIKQRSVKGRILMVVNNPAFFLSHRLNVANHAVEQGYEVIIATMAGEAVSKIREHGFQHYEIPMSRSGMNPVQELSTIHALYRLYKSLSPDLVHLVTIKAVLYGGIAARLAGVKSVVFAISGMGYMFTDEKQKTGLTARITATLYRLALGHKHYRVIVQNPHDEEILKRIAYLDTARSVLIKGSGANLDQYKPTEEPAEPPVIVAMAARLLKDKGVMEYAQAAAESAEQGLPITWRLAGSLDQGNPSSLTQQELNGISGDVEYVGEQKDIASFYSGAHIVALPSYREGLPKSLVEAASCQRAVVTTDVPGCRDAIVPDKTGLLVPVKDAQSLLEAVKKLAEDKDLRQQMAQDGRALAEQEFDEKLIAARQVGLYDELIREAASKK